ncbi:MAG: hypothetical protein AAGF32_02410 [Pseudomonadota bacterium]
MTGSLKNPMCAVVALVCLATAPESVVAMNADAAPPLIHPACTGNLADLGIIGQGITFRGAIDGTGAANYCGVFNVAQDGCFKFENHSKDEPQLRAELYGAGDAPMRRFLSYTPNNGITGPTIELLPGRLTLKLQYLGAARGVFRYAVSRVTC